MAAKVIEAVADTGQTLYAVIRREADGYYMNDADGSFAAAPADYFLTLSEHATVKGFYSASESRATWNDGLYTFIPYIQTGGSPAIASDIPGEAEQMVIQSNAEVTLGTVYGGVLFTTSSLLGFRTLMDGLASSMTEVMKQLRILLAQILDLEKKIRRESK